MSSFLVIVVEHTILFGNGSWTCNCFWRWKLSMTFSLVMVIEHANVFGNGNWAYHHLWWLLLCIPSSLVIAIKHSMIFGDCCSILLMKDAIFRYNDLIVCHLFDNYFPACHIWWGMSGMPFSLMVLVLHAIFLSFFIDGPLTFHLW